MIYEPYNFNDSYYVDEELSDLIVNLSFLNVKSDNNLIEKNTFTNYPDKMEMYSQ
jgi:hypothetical protein